MKRLLFLALLTALYSCKSSQVGKSKTSNNDQSGTIQEEAAANDPSQVQTKSLIENALITVDFASPKYPPVIAIRPKQTLEIELKNLNPYLYEVSVKDSLLVFQTEQPALFGQIFKLPELEATPTETPPANDKVAGKAPDPNSSAKRAKEDEGALEQALKTFLAGYSGKENNAKDLLILSTIADDIGKLLTDCYSTLDELKTTARSYIVSKIPELDVASLPIGVQTEITNKSTALRNDLERYVATGTDLKKRYLAILERADGDMTLTQYKSIEKDVKEKIALIDKILENIKKIQDKIKAFDEANVGATIEENYKKIATSRTNRTILRPTNYSTDEVNVFIQVKKKKEVFCNPEINSFPVIALVKGGVKIDFSTGVVFNMGRQYFFNQNYYYDSVRRGDGKMADSVRITRNRNNNILVPSIGAFLHVYSRLNSQVNIGGMVGASLGADQRAYIHVGGCLLLGKSDRLVIGGGVSIANAKTLDGQYSEGQVIKRSLAPTQIPREDATRVGAFVSLSWNLNLVK
ncbi:hypothetical protein ACAW74_16425 [Fibrella sp. WM1]|uniref:hypothetical protein n=1 Tax=Fibrella musci TaxID=3242485 RepID=UPI0035229906